jgi:hypothetical protein
MWVAVRAAFHIVSQWSGIGHPKRLLSPPELKFTRDDLNHNNAAFLCIQLKTAIIFTKALEQMLARRMHGVPMKRFFA